MNAFLRKVFLALACLMVAYVVLMAFALHAGGQPLAKAKTLWVGTVAAAGFAAVALRASVPVRFKLLLVLLAGLMLEFILEITAWAGVLPAVNTKERVPWGRVYWTAEGRGNSIRNRYGWHFPEFNLEKTNRVAVIGDSFVEAVEVHRGRNFSALLRKYLQRTRPNMTVLGLGNHGVGPAHYLEILKYSHRQFGVNEAIVSIYLGNDITDCSAKLQFHDTSEFIYYDAAADGTLRLLPASALAQERYAKQLEFPHRSPWLSAPRIVASHCMMLQLPLSVRNTIRTRKRAEADSVRSGGFELDLARLGLKAEPFAISPKPEVVESMMILTGLLDSMKGFANANGIKLRVMSIPFFPPDFFKNPNADWDGRVGQYDLLGPERALAEWASKRGVDFLPLGERMRGQKLARSDVRSFYLSNGSGHFSESGHRFAATAMQEAFLSQPANH